MTENPERISLQAQLGAVTAAMSMHIERAEKLAFEAELIKHELDNVRDPQEVIEA